MMMRLLRLFSFHVRDAVKSLVRNFSLTLASVFSMTITLLIVAVAIILSYNVNSFASFIKSDVTVVVFLDKDVSFEEIEQIEEDIKNTNNIATIELVTKEETRVNMSDQNETLKTIMDNWDEGENPLHDSFLLKIKDIEKISDTANDIRDMDKVYSVSYGEGMVSKIIDTFKVVEKINIAVVVTLIIVSMFLISNTIKVTIFSRKREIEIMRLVGASNTSIKMPFMIEGLFTGLIGSIIPILATSFGYIYVYDYFGGNFLSPLFKLMEPSQVLLVIIPSILIIAGVIGMFGSTSAVRKYLKI